MKLHLPALSRRLLRRSVLALLGSLTLPASAGDVVGKVTVGDRGWFGVGGVNDDGFQKGRWHQPSGPSTDGGRPTGRSQSRGRPAARRAGTP